MPKPKFCFKCHANHNGECWEYWLDAYNRLIAIVNEFIDEKTKKKPKESY